MTIAGRLGALGVVLVMAINCGADGTADPDGLPDARSLPAEGSEGPFIEISTELGLPDEELGSRDMPFGITGGASAADVDGDGWIDLFVTRSTGPNRLYRNVDGQGFEDITVEAGLAEDHPSGTSAWADVDGDGCLDVYVTTVTVGANRLFMGDCEGQFIDEARERGLDFPTETGRSVKASQDFAASFADWDRDGDLDLFVGQWRLREHDTNALPNRNRLLRNDGTGRFTDVTEELGLADMDASSFTATFADIDDDDWPDLLLTADFSTSRVFKNRSGTHFVDVTDRSGAGSDENGMGSVVDDLDGDGDLDWFITSISQTPTECATATLDRCSGNRLFLGEGSRFVDATDAAGLRYGHWGWGAAAVDLDSDADLDLAMTTESYFPDRDADQIPDPNVVWRNDDGAYQEVASELGLDGDGSGKSLIAADIDNDGDQDLLIANTFSGVDVYRNDLGADGWISVRLRGTPPNTAAIGAIVTVQADEGGPVQRQDIRSGDTFLGTRPLQAWFGLADHEGPLHEVTVRWPGASEETVLNDIPANEPLLIDEGA